MSDFKKTVEKIYWLGQQIKGLEEEREELYASLGTLDVRDYAAGPYILKVTRTVRFDPVLARKVLDPAQFQSILATKPDAALAKAVLDPDTYKSVQKEYGLTRRIVPVDDED